MIEDISSAVLNINVPTLVLAGENDQVERVATLAQESIPLIRFRQLLMSDWNRVPRLSLGPIT
jgi:hypothetical protein